MTDRHRQHLRVDHRTARVLVIKLGALGDFVQATGAFAGIRAYHPRAHVVLLTTAPYESLARASGWFDEVWTDSRPKLRDISQWLALRRRLRRGRFERVYDLQTSDRTGLYFRLLGPGRRPEWSGTVRGCSHPHTNPERRRMHTLARLADQLRTTGVTMLPGPRLDGIDADITRFRLPQPYVLLVPGSSAHRTDKRWPAENYAALARSLAVDNVTSVVIGTVAEQQQANLIAASAASARSLAGQTTLAEIVAMARDAVGAVGNDTGPMHLIAGAGTPSLVLFSGASDPALCGQQGPDVTILRREPLWELPVAEVEAHLRLR
ncbi:MAG: glycosyltransferase family 9 protein [Alphaproteobacteria bacterium]